MTRYRFRVAIPLIGFNPQLANTPIGYALQGKLTQSDYKRLTWESHLATLNATLLKPGRRLGGAWIDQFVALGRDVNICVSCNARYGDWWKRYSYKPTKPTLADCDGCGEPLVSCIGFAPEIEPPKQERVN